MRCPSAASEPCIDRAGDPGRRHADEDGRAVAFHQSDRLFGGAGDADGDEHVVGLAAAGEFAHPRGDVVGLGIDGVRGAERARGLELGVRDVDGE